MRALIIEDEHIAAQALEKIVREVAPGTEILGVLQSIDESVEWFRTHAAPDLVFMDIHLADGSSFSIFEEVEITCPVIFTTAYDEYALKAFEVNSIDYLLKPISREAVERALSKYQHYAGKDAGAADSELIKNLLAEIRQKSSAYKTSLLVSHRDRLIPLAVKDIAYIHIDSKIVRAHTFTGQSFVLEQSMEELAERLDPQNFFRANRQYIVAREAVKDMSLWFGSKLALNLNVTTPERIYISKARVKEFKSWITGDVS